MAIFSHLKRLESYPTRMSDASLFCSFIPPSRSFSDRVPVAVCHIPAGKPGESVRVEGTLMRKKTSPAQQHPWKWVVCAWEIVQQDILFIPESIAYCCL